MKLIKSLSKSILSEITTRSKVKLCVTSLHRCLTSSYGLLLDFIYRGSLFSIFNNANLP